MKKGLLISGAFLALIVIVVLVVGAWGVGKYNSFVTGQEEVKRRWGQVENVYQRRADLIPNLVEVVKGYAKHEKETLTQVIEARSKATQVKIDPSKLDAAAIAKFQQGQDSLSSTLSRLMVVVEQYPNLKANENFRDLQSQLEGTENRITVERMEFNKAAQKFNTVIKLFPGSIVANMFGFKEAAYFQSEKGAEKAPKVSF